MKIFTNILVISAALFVFVQCAKKEDENYDERELTTFELWVERNAPANVEKQANGSYIQWIRRGTSSIKLNEDDFMVFDYVGRDLNGSIFSNRDSALAVDEGTFTRFTHYVPDYAVFNKFDYYLTVGEYDALALMSEGDSIRLYLPSQLAYRTTNSTYFAFGYEGWYNSTSNPRNNLGTPSFIGKAVIIDLALREVVPDPIEREEIQATEVAATLGCTQDTVGIFYRIVEQPAVADLITSDSSFYMTYSVKMLDNFLFATNDPDAAYEGWGDNWTSYSPVSYSTNFLQNSTSGLSITALDRLISQELVTYNSTIQIVFTSEWAYGVYGYGASSTNPAIMPYTPLRMDVKIYEYGYDPDEEEEE